MKSIALPCVSLLVVFGLCQGLVRRPSMIPTGRELIIQEGDELRLDCRGEGEIQFSTLETMAGVINSNYEISEDENSGTYTFIRPAAIREDTGWYACAEKGVDITNNEQNIDHESEDIAWIYVYVNSSEPFVVDTVADLVTGVEGSILVVPCRTTSPDLKVRAEIWGGTHVPVNMEYDPKIGFILRDVSSRLTMQSFDCVIDEPKQAIASYSLHILESKRLPQPTINPHQIRHIVWGKDLTVDCEITLDAHTKFSMSWILPESIPKERWSYTPDQILVRTETDKRETWKTVLTVKNVEETDGGNYTCHVFNPMVENYATEVIRIWDPRETHIQVKSSEQMIFDEKEEAIWKLEIDSWPEYLSLEWFKPNGESVVPDESKRNGKYTYNREGLYHHFKITNLTVEDTGTYKIKVSNGYDVKEISIHQIVRAKPSVSIDEVLPIYPSGETATFTCQTLGFPLPNITWTVKEYPDSTSNGDPVIKYPSNVSNKLGERGSYHSVSTLKVEVNQTGEVTCRACNEINCTDTTEPIIVSESTAPMIEDEHINQLLIPVDFAEEKRRSLPLECLAEGMPVPRVSWYKNDQLLLENDQYKFLDNNRKLLITYFLEGDSGRYTCRATNRVGQAEKHMHIEIIGYNSSDTSCRQYQVIQSCEKPTKVDFLSTQIESRGL